MRQNAHPCLAAIFRVNDDANRICSLTGAWPGGTASKSYSSDALLACNAAFRSAVQFACGQYDFHWAAARDGRLIG